MENMLETKSNETLVSQGFQFIAFEEVEVSEASEQIGFESDLECEELQQEKPTIVNPTQPGKKIETKFCSQSDQIAGPSNFGSNIVQYRHFSPQQLEHLLGKTVTGQNILKRGAIGPLSVDSQRELVHIIVEYHCSVGIQAKEDTLRWYSECIVALFKHEKTVSILVLINFCSCSEQAIVIKCNCTKTETKTSI